MSHVTAFAEEMKSAGADYQLIVYGNAMHGFTHETATGQQPGVVEPGERGERVVWRDQAYRAACSVAPRHCPYICFRSGRIVPIRTVHHIVAVAQSRHAAGEFRGRWIIKIRKLYGAKRVICGAADERVA